MVVYGSFAVFASCLCVAGLLADRVLINYLIPLLLSLLLLVAFILGPTARTATWLPYVLRTDSIIKHS